MSDEPTRPGDVVMNVRISLVLLIALATACGSAPRSAAPVASGAVDCGSFEAGHDAYDAAGVDCFWRAYSAGTPVRWAVKRLTIEGDPVRETIQFVPGQGLVVTRDVSADRFSSPSDRRVWTYRCAAMVRTPWATGATRSFFELTGCTGDGATTAFP